MLQNTSDQEDARKNEQFCPKESDFGEIERTEDKGVARGGTFEVAKGEEGSKTLRDRLGRVAQTVAEELLHSGRASESTGAVVVVVQRTHGHENR